MKNILIKNLLIIYGHWQNLIRDFLKISKMKMLLILLSRGYEKCEIQGHIIVWLNYILIYTNNISGLKLGWINHHQKLFWANHILQRRYLMKLSDITKNRMTWAMYKHDLILSSFDIIILRMNERNILLFV
jgi:hypothetical protein